jgi:hypothetical protein
MLILHRLLYDRLGFVCKKPPKIDRFRGRQVVEFRRGFASLGYYLMLQKLHCEAERGGYRKVSKAALTSECLAFRLLSYELR